MNRWIWVSVGGVLIALTVWQSLDIAHPVRADDGARPAARRAEGTLRAEGRVVTYPGRRVTISAEVLGRIRSVTALEGQTVHAGDVLVEIDDADLRAERAVLRTELNAARVDSTHFTRERERAATLVPRGALAAEVLDERAHAVATSTVRASRVFAGLRRIDVSLEKYRLASPIDGIVIVRDVEVGEVVSPGAGLIEIADVEHARIEAEIDEFDAHRIHVGTRATVRAEGLDGKSWDVVVEEVPRSVEQRRLRPQDPGRPVDTRVLLVKLTLPERTGLFLGQRVEIDFSPSNVEARAAVTAPIER